MKGVLHAVIGTPDSNRRATLSHASKHENDKTNCNFLLPTELECSNSNSTHWEWIDKQLKIKSLIRDDINEWFLFFSNEIDVADQFESLKDLIDQKEELEIGRILTFFNTDYLIDITKDLQNWIDACAHFSDAFCFTNRTNQNSQGLSSIIERYKSMRYPLETFILAKTKDPPIDRILCPIARRISHIFDPVDILEPEDSSSEDPFLKRLPNGKRINPLPIPEWKNI